MSQNISQFIEGLNTFFIGVTVVFVTLLLLIIMITLLGKVVDSLTNKAKKEPEKVEPTPSASVQEEVAVTTASEMQDELELVAVITATIVASLGTTSDQLQVKSLRKVPRKVL